MSEGRSQASVIRQWISVGGSSCDQRVGPGALGTLGQILKGSVGKPHLCALATEDGMDEGIVERVRRQLTDVGFEVRRMGLTSGREARTLDAAGRLSAQLLEAGITSDDLICALGSVDVLSTASLVAGGWCGGTPLSLVVTDIVSCVECATTPRGIDVGGAREMLSVRPSAKHLICDLDVADVDPSHDASVLVRAHMAATAIVDNEKAVERLWDRAELVAAGDVETLAAQLCDTVKSRGHVMSSTAISLRQSMGFGQTFMRALSRLTGVEGPSGTYLAEGIRFQARLAAGMDLLPVDDVLTIDELLELLELEAVTCAVDPDELVAELRRERFARSGRFLLGLPRKLGQVRLSSVEDDLLLEHARAWCAAHAPS